MRTAPASLKLGRALALPVDYATDTGAALGMRGAGKSNTLVVIAEELNRARVPFVVIDPKGDHWGIRSSADGTKPGLAVPVFGGRHGDLPLDPGAGPFMADLILGRLLSCVIDVSRFTKADRTRFLTAFGRRLYDEAEDDPIHLLLEEAHDYIPQSPDEGERKCISVYADIVRWGRTKGLGCTLASQRAAVVNKNVLNQCQVLFAHRVIAKLDRKAISDWIEHHGLTHEVVSTLHSLGAGEAWVSAPTIFQGEPPRRVQFRRRRTFDSGATPKVGEKRRVPSTIADIDIEALRAQMAEAIERAEANDPDALRRQVAQLRRELAAAKKAPPGVARPTAAPAVQTVVKEIKVPWPDRALVGRAEAAAARIERASDKMSAALAGGATVAEGFAELSADLRKLIAQGPAAPAPEVPPRPAQAGRRSSTSGTGAPVQRPAAARPPAPPSPPVDDSGEPIQIKPGAMRILVTLARHHPLQLTRTQLATLAGFRIGKGSGTWDTYISVLRRAGYIDTSVPGMILITEAGLAAAGVEAAEPMTTEEVLEMWRSKLKAGARRMLDVLIEIYPEEATPEELGERSGLTVPSGTFDTYFSTLRRNGLMVVNGAQGNRKVRASDALFVAA